MRAEFYGMNYYANMIFFEYLSLGGFVDIVSAMGRSATDIANEKSFQEFY
jgi:hypothetical protein